MLIFSFTDLEDTTLALDFRVSVLEENGGGEGNSSVAELEVRVEVLEGTTANHETRISAAESNINGKNQCLSVMDYVDEFWIRCCVFSSEISELILEANSGNCGRTWHQTDDSLRKHIRCQGLKGKIQKKKP